MNGEVICRSREHFISIKNLACSSHVEFILFLIEARANNYNAAHNSATMIYRKLYPCISRLDGAGKVKVNFGATPFA